MGVTAGIVEYRFVSDIYFRLPPRIDKLSMLSPTFDNLPLCKLCRGLKPSQILDLRDLAPQALGTPHRMPEDRRLRP